MRTALKFTLLCVVAITATTFPTSNVSATEPVSVIDEATSEACNPCVFHAVGEVSLVAFHTFTISTCEDEFSAEIDPTGSGEVTLWEGVNHPVDGVCTREMCTEPNMPGGVPEHWPLDMEEVGLNEVQMNVAFCITTTDGDHQVENRCVVPVHVTEEAGENHHYFFGLLHECTIDGTPVTVTGDWETEEPHNSGEEDEVEILHAP